MRLSQILVIIAACALTSQAAGIGQVSAWDIVKKHERMAQEMKEAKNGVAKASPYGAPDMENAWERGKGMGFWDATSLRWVKKYSNDWYDDTGAGLERWNYLTSYVTQHSEVGHAIQVIDITTDTSSRTDYSYNSNNLCTLAISSKWLSENSWEYTEKSVIAYDSNDSLSSITTYLWEGNAADWANQPSVTDSLSYNIAGQLDYSTQSIQEGSFFTSFTRRYSYGTDGLLQGFIQVRTGGDTILGTTIYPEPGVQVNLRMYFNSDMQSWTMNDSAIAEYNSDGRQTKYTSLYWDIENNNYAKNFMISMEYGLSGQIDSFIVKRPNDEGVWIDENLGIYIYDEEKLAQLSTPRLRNSIGQAAQVHKGDRIVLKIKERANVCIRDARGRLVCSQIVKDKFIWNAPGKGLFFVSVTQNGITQHHRFAAMR